MLLLFVVQHASLAMWEHTHSEIRLPFVMIVTLDHTVMPSTRECITFVNLAVVSLMRHLLHVRIVRLGNMLMCIVFHPASDVPEDYLTIEVRQAFASAAHSGLILTIWGNQLVLDVPLEPFNKALDYLFAKHV